MGMQRPLSVEDRLEILRAADLQRKWFSLDDQRMCIGCNKLITGRQIEITRDQRGRFLLQCPTSECRSIAKDWFYQGSVALRQSPISFA